MRVKTLFLLVAMCIFAVPMAGHAQESADANPTISHVAIGYSKNVRSNTWAPVLVAIENPGPAAEAEIVVFNEEVGGLRLPGMTRSRVHLPAYSVRRHTIYVQDQGSKDYVFELRVDGRRVDQLKDSPFRISQRQSFILGLSMRRRQATCDPKSDIIGLTDQIKFGNITTMQALPDRWQALTSAEAILLGDLPGEGLSVAQEKALVEWVRAGGILILCPAGTDERYENSLLATLSPVQIVGTRMVSAIPPLEREYGAMDGEGLRIRVPLTEVVVLDGTVHMEADQMPLVVSKREGLGRVVFVAFDLTAQPVKTVKDLLFFYQDILALRTGLPGAERLKVPVQASSVLNETMGVPVLSRWVLAICLALNFLFVTVVLSRKNSRREMGFLLLVVLAPVIAIVLSFLGQRIVDVPERALGSVSVVSSASGQSFGAGSGYYALLSQSEERWDIAFPDEEGCFPGTISALRSDNGSGESAADAFSEVIEVMDEDSKWIKQFHVLPRSLAKFQTNYVTDLGGSIRAQTSYGEDGLEVQVTNDSDKVFRDGFVICNRSMQPIKDLQPGENTRVRLDSDSAFGLMGRFSRGEFRSQEEVHHNRIVRSLYTSANLARLADTGVLACGWFDGEPPGLSPAGIPATKRLRSETLWVIEAEGQRAKGEVLLPKGTPAMRIRSVRGQPIQDGKWVPLAGKHVMDVSFQIPETMQGLEIKRASLFFRTEQAPAKACLKVYNVETDTYDTIAPDSAAGGEEMQILSGNTFELPHPETCFSAERGDIRVRVEVDSAAASNTEVVTSSVRYPIIKDFDMEIQGTCP